MLYAFFAASPYRWGVLLKQAPVTLKRVIDTRWSAHRAAVNALHTGFDEIMDDLEELCNSSENLNARGDAHGNLKEFELPDPFTSVTAATLNALNHVRVNTLQSRNTLQ